MIRGEKMADRTGLRSAFIILLTGFAFVLSMGVANAGTATGPKGYFSAGSANYSNYSRIITGGTGSDQGRTGTNSLSGNRPAGHFGNLARAYTSGGALKCSKGYTYTTGSSSGLSTLCFFNGVSGSAYYSYGVSKGWTGSAYKAVYAPKSPNQNG